MKRYSPRVSVSSRYKKITIGVDIANTGNTSVNISKIDEEGYIWCPYVPIMLEPEIVGWEPTPEQVRLEREKKLKRIYGN